MGCFLVCFGASKNRQHQRRRAYVQPQGNRISDALTKGCHLNAEVSAAEEVPKTSLIPITDACDKVEEKCNQSPTRKRVTFDSNVTTYEHVLQEESADEEKPVKSSQTESLSRNSSLASNSSGTFPPNHRYQNCVESDDEEGDELDCSDSDLDDENGLLDEDYYSDDEIYYGNKLQNQAKEAVYSKERGDNGLAIEEEIETKPRGSNASARDRSGYVHSVLNPVENLTQWKAVKSKGRTIQTQPQKENHNIVSSSPLKELAVDASLSTWLSVSEATSACSVSMVGFESITPERNTSCESKLSKCHDERPILGALTVEEIKQLSITSSPRKSPSKSPDDMPIIGSVGTYWNHSKTTKGVSNTANKYREDKRVVWDSTPFEERLERALNKGGH